MLVALALSKYKFSRIGSFDFNVPNEEHSLAVLPFSKLS